MTYFTDIASVYGSLIRDIPTLSGLYDAPQTREMIQRLVLNRLDEAHVRGKRILLKPNWVKHNRRQVDVSDEMCLRTHDSVVLAVLETVLMLGPARVVIGDAPIQGCHWPSVVRPAFLTIVEDLRRRYGIAVDVKDFRRVTFDHGNNALTTERNPISDYVIFDLGTSSHLEPITDGRKHRFRVTDYDPDRLVESHAPGVHKYCITKELFESDVVISIPKVKTHQKTGITNALKNIVGLNGDKDYLPHHRKGGTRQGGDCYPGGNALRSWSEHLLDVANRRRGQAVYPYLKKASIVLFKLSLPGAEHDLAASWHGNDTTWRMVLDLNMIVEYGTFDGTLSAHKQRALYSFCDGIIAGQGDGPLNPEPLALGVLCFTNHSASADVAMATMMGFDYSSIPLVANVYDRIHDDRVEIQFDGQLVDISDLKSHSIATKPPPGWVRHLSQ